MSDIVDRLRASVTQCRAVDRSELLAEAAAEIERLRDALTREPGTAVLDNCVPGNQPEMGCPVTKPMPKEKQAEVSVGLEPVAFAVVSDSSEQIDCEFVYPDEATAGDVALDINGGVVPLYRHRQPVVAETATTALTDAERVALRDAAESFEYDDDGQDCARVAATLRGLLERLK